MERTNGPTLQVTYTCGCGFKCDRQSLAVPHSKEFGHTLTVNGVIRSEVQHRQQNRSTQIEKDTNKDGIQEISRRPRSRYEY